jgi:Rod binding domain-containing protein
MQPAAVTDFAPLADLRRAARAQDPAALRQTAQQFEGLLIQQML